ncbi:MAG TPA: VOC family protein, partial [Microlunatus sp.]|nr:VOC family protein [Microlunatus sp.]
MALLNPYLSFSGNAREALEFYQSVFGGDLSVSTFGDFGMPGLPEEAASQIMHGQLTTTAGFTVMGADAPPGMELPSTGNGTISISGDETDELRGYWNALAEGGRVD